MSTASTATSVGVQTYLGDFNAYFDANW
jgi:hypothetical protein